MSITPTVGTLAWATIRLIRASRLRADAALLLLAQQNAVTECIRLVKHSLCVFGLLAPFIWLPWPYPKVRDACLVTVCILLGATSMWSLYGMIRFTRLRERERVILKPKM